MSVMVSVIIPAYNAQKYIYRSINSVLQQTYQLFELIIVDDYSTDNTNDIVTQLSHNNRKIKFIQNQRKKGPSGARNTGLLRAEGQYIAFLDADDMWHPEHLRKGITYLESYNNLDAIFFNFNIIDSANKQQKKNWFAERKFTTSLITKTIEKNLHIITENMFHALLDESFIQLQSLMLRRRVCLNVVFNEEIMRAEDLDFIIRVYLESKAKFAFSNTITSDYYRHDNSLTTHSMEKIVPTLIDHITLFRSYFVKHVDDKIAMHKLRNILYDRHLNLSYCYRKQLDHYLALCHLLNSVRYRVNFIQIKELAKILVSTVQSVVPVFKLAKF